MYREAQMWPRPPRYHRGRRKRTDCRSGRGYTEGWERARGVRRTVGRELRGEDWRGELQEDVIDELDSEAKWEDGEGEGEWERDVGLGEFVDGAVARWEERWRRRMEEEGWWVVECELASSAGVVSLDGDERDCEDEFELI